MFEVEDTTIVNIKKQIKKAKRGMFTPMSLDLMEETLRQFKEQQKEVKRDERKKKKEYQKAEKAFCAELVAQGYPPEWVPNEDTLPRWNPV